VDSDKVRTKALSSRATRLAMTIFRLDHLPFSNPATACRS
jgi:hypothetical protein